MPKYNPINAVFCLFLISCIIFLIVAPFVLLPKINPAYKFDGVERDGVFLELWQIDTFEGGTSSRAKFLEKMAMQYEKKNKGVYIIVRNLTEEQAVAMLGEDKVPNIISFGIGVGDKLCAYTQKVSTNANIRSPLLKAGQIANEQYAIPWCMGGYVLCGQKSDNAKFGVGMQFNIPPKVNVQNITKFDSQYAAYCAFCENQFDVLVGTQRDYYRLTNKLNLGAISQCNFEFNNQYTDIVQFVSVTSTNEQISSHASNYIQFLVGDYVQSKLVDIGMFGVTNQSIYQSGQNKEFEQSLMQINNVQNVFTSIERIKELQSKF